MRHRCSYAGGRQVAPLQIGREDIDLRNCRVGNCDIRLPRNVIERFQRDIDWNAPGLIADDYWEGRDHYVTELLSDPGSSKSVYAEVGQMRNGVFFS